MAVSGFSFKSEMRVSEVRVSVSGFHFATLNLTVNIDRLTIDTCTVADSTAVPQKKEI